MSKFNKYISITTRMVENTFVERLTKLLKFLNSVVFSEEAQHLSEPESFLTTSTQSLLARQLRTYSKDVLFLQGTLTKLSALRDGGFGVTVTTTFDCKLHLSLNTAVEPSL